MNIFLCTTVSVWLLEVQSRHQLLVLPVVHGCYMLPCNSSVTPSMATCIVMTTSANFCCSLSLDVGGRLCVFDVSCFYRKPVFQYRSDSIITSTGTGTSVLFSHRLHLQNQSFFGGSFLLEDLFRERR